MDQGVVLELTTASGCTFHSCKPTHACFHCEFRSSLPTSDKAGSSCCNRPLCWQLAPSSSGNTCWTRRSDRSCCRCETRSSLEKSRSAQTCYCTLRSCQP